MSRPLRINLPDLTHHIFNRGNSHQFLFNDEDGYLHYLGIIKRYKAKFKFHLYAYCLMRNHIHLLLKPSREGTISEIMKAITIAHTRYYHIKYKTYGHIWQGRFRSPIVSDDEYLLTLMRYIEQNPVRAGISNHPQEYRFSSYNSNINVEKDFLVDKEENSAFLSLGNTIEERTQRYRQFASMLLESGKIKDIRSSINGQRYYGSEEFRNQIKTRIGVI